MDILFDLLSSFDPTNPNFRPTEIYNECWLIKLVLHQSSAIPDINFPLGFLPGSSWFSEALLPTAFKPRIQGDPLGEGRTNADGVIGQIQIGIKGKADLELQEGVTQFTVVEAKVGAPFSKDTKKTKDYDQVARSVACVAEVLNQAGIIPSSLEYLDFIVLAPAYSIEKGTYSKEMDKASIQSKVHNRIAAYDGDHDQWFRDHFEPTLKKIRLASLSWESALEWIGDYKPLSAEKLKEYYELCLKFN